MRMCSQQSDIFACSLKEIGLTHHKDPEMNSSSKQASSASLICKKDKFHRLFPNLIKLICCKKSVAL